MAISDDGYALKQSSQNSQVHWKKGINYFEQRQIEKAIEEFNQVLKINPWHQQLNYHLGLCYHQKKEFPQALAQFNRALKLNPKEERIHRELGFCYLDLKQIGKAIDELRQVLEISPKSQHGHLGLGFCYLEQRQIEKAIDEFNHVLKLNPQNEHAHCGLGQAYFQQKQYDLALEAFNKAITIDAELEPVHQDLGTIYLERGLYNLAQAEFEETLRLNADNIFAHQMLGYVYKRQGKHNLAVTEFIKATNLYLTKEKANKKSVNKDDVGFVAKILRMPSFWDKGKIPPTELKFTLLPPLALGQIIAYLKASGIEIDRDDLNIKIHYDNYYSKMAEKEIDISVFFDEDRILRYLSGAEDEDLESIMEKVERKSRFYGYNIILLSLPDIFRNSSCLMFTLSLSRFLKKKYNPILILGGASQSIDLLSKYDCKDIDFIIYGSGEVTLRKLLLALKNETDLADFLGSQIKENGKFISTEVHPPLKPDFSGLPIDKYRYRGLNSSYNDESCEILKEFKRSATLLLTFRFIIGCPYECIFCPISTSKSMYALEPSRVALYLKELKEEYNPTGFFLLSDTINISKQYINELCEEIIKHKTKILWSDCARPDNLDRDTLFKMREAGCIRLVFGMETASARLLKYVNKRIGLGGLENILKWSDEAGIWTGLEIVCGLPYEKDDDIKETIKFLNRNEKYINSLYINQFDLRDGSVLFQNGRNFGIENIIEINQYVNEEFIFFHKYGYDEIDGLKWQDKKRQIIFSYKKLLNNSCGQIPFPTHEFEHFLFFLYTKFNDKQQICNAFYEAVEQKNKQLQKS